MFGLLGAASPPPVVSRITRENRHEAVVLPSLGGPASVMTLERYWEAEARGQRIALLFGLCFMAVLGLSEAYFHLTGGGNLLTRLVMVAFFAYAFYRTALSWHSRRRIMAELNDARRQS